MKTPFTLAVLSLALAIVGPSAHAGFFDQLKSTLTTSNGAVAAVSALPEAEIAGGFGAILPQLRSEVARYGLRVVAAATLSNLMSATIAGLFIGLA